MELDAKGKLDAGKALYRYERGSLLLFESLTQEIQDQYLNRAEVAVSTYLKATGHITVADETRKR